MIEAFSTIAKITKSNSVEDTLEALFLEQVNNPNTIIKIINFKINIV